MTALSDLTKSANAKMVHAQLHHAERPGAGQANAFNVDIDKIVAGTKTEMENLHALDGTNVTAAKSALDTLAAAVKSGGPVVPPAAVV